MTTFTLRSPTGSARLSIALELTIAQVRYVKGRLGIDLLQPGSTPQDSAVPVAQLLHHDIEQFVNVLWLLCESQFRQLALDHSWPLPEASDSLTPLEMLFVQCLDQLGEAKQAFWEEWQLFFDQAGLSDVAATVRKQRELSQVAGKQIQQLDLTEPVSLALGQSLQGLLHTPLREIPGTIPGS